MECINWPKEMKNWEFRKRRQNWPNKKTLKMVMDAGCDVIITPFQLAFISVTLVNEVSVMRYPKMMISFSKAETILMRSFTPVQQIVYHMLRCFAKAELFPASSSLCTYHIKTLMFWSVEEKPRHWWEENNVVVICCQLLHDFSVMLSNGCCKNYFLPKYNLFKYFDNRKDFLKRFNADIYSNRDMFVHWFYNSCLEEEMVSVFPPVPETVKQLARFCPLWYKALKKGFGTPYYILFECNGKHGRHIPFKLVVRVIILIILYVFSRIDTVNWDIMHLMSLYVILFY